jgi:hypothetical protein
MGRSLRNYPPELRERAVEMVREIRADRVRPLRRVVDLGGVLHRRDPGVEGRACAEGRGVLKVADTKCI